MLFYACDRDPRQSAIAMADRHIEAAPDFAIRVVAAFMHELGYPFPEYPAPPSYALPVECKYGVQFLPSCRHILMAYVLPGISGA